MPTSGAEYAFPMKGVEDGLTKHEYFALHLMTAILTSDNAAYHRGECVLDFDLVAREAVTASKALVRALNER